MDKRKKICFVTSIVQVVYLANILLKTKKRRFWVRPLYQNRKAAGFFETTFAFIKQHDADLFFKATRMTKLQYELLLNLLRQSLRKTSIRKAISPECRLVVTLMYLSQGVSPNYLAWSFRMGVSTVRKIIVEVCAALWDVLSPVYMPELNAPDWINISRQFNSRWNMPNCVGSIDGKHIEIKCPPNTGSKYINYKGYFSVVLMAICDANYTFTAVDVGAFGSQSDAGIFRHSVIGKKMYDNNINLPLEEKLPNSQRTLPLYFVGDSAFPLRKNLTRPYPGNLLNHVEEVFNFRLSRARRVIENTFGILAARWRILGKCIEFHPRNADKVVLACTILHNFIKITGDLYDCNSYCPGDYCDSLTADGERIYGTWRQEAKELLPIRRCGTNNRPDEAFSVRRTLTNYFLNEGKIAFQPIE